MTRDEFHLARHLAKQHTEQWVAIGCDVFAEGHVIGSMRTELLARLVCASHNVFLDTSNRLLMTLRRLKDVKELSK